MDSAEFVGADTVERGTWLSLQRYNIGQENSGLIEDCAKWKDRQWQQLCRVTLKEVRREARLFRWEGNDLRVFYYPQEAEDIVRMKRLVAQENGKLGGRPVKNPNETERKPTLVISGKAKGKETWFLGAITDENARTSEIKLDFLTKEKKYKAIIYEDARDADWKNNPIAYKTKTLVVTSKSKIKLNLAPGGGTAISFEPIQ